MPNPLPPHQLVQMLQQVRNPRMSSSRGCYPQMADKPCILMDDCKGGYLLTRHLLETGRRNIIGIFKADDSQGAQRHKGYVQALQESGIPYDPENVIWFHTEDRKTKPSLMLSMLLDSKSRRLLQRPDRARRHLHAGRKGNLRAGRHRRHRIRQLADRPEQSDRDHDHCPSAGKTR